jgi:F0F1-type ATP synthase membrane subunit b/b'
VREQLEQAAKQIRLSKEAFTQELSNLQMEVDSIIAAAKK